jgi:hypothetical protein
MTEDDIRLAAEALGVIPRSKTRPKSLEVPPGGLSQAQRQTQQTLSEGIKSAAERREAEESEAWGKKVEETTTPSEKIRGGLEAAVALPSGAAMGILGQLGEGFKLLPPGGANKFVAENTFLPRTEAGQRYFDVMAGGVENAAEAFGETPMGEFLGATFEKVPGIFPVSGAATRAVDEGIMGAGKGIRLASEQARQAGKRTMEAGKDLAQAARAEFATPPIGAIDASIAAKVLPKTKVRDEAGNPMLLYHGTNKDYENFSAETMGTKTGNPTSRLGFFFSPSPTEASRYAADWGKEGGNVRPVYLDIKNPKRLTYKQMNDISMASFDESLPVNAWKTKEGQEAIRSAGDRANKMAFDLRQQLINEGYDGAVVKIGGKDEYIAFHPEQIRPALSDPEMKSLMESQGKKAPAPERQVIAAPRNPLGMYSQAEQVALNLPQQKGTGNQFLAQISKTPGVKPSELEWTGLTDFLKSKGDKPVTKQEIQQHLDANRVQVKEVVFDDKMPSNNIYDQLPRGYTFIEDTDRDGEFTGKLRIVDSDGDTIATSDNVEDLMYRAGFDYKEPAPSAVYGEYQLPGGSNYREVLLTLPSKVDTSGYKVTGSGNQWYLRGPDNQIIEAFPSEAEAKAKIPNRAAASQPELFKSTHFNQPNILAHMRLNDRVDANGDKVLFVEEMQSDWGQMGKKKGFQSPEELATKNAKLADLKARFDKSIERFEKAQTRYNNRTPSDNDLDLIMEMRNANNEADFLRQEIDKIGTVGLPPAPFVQNTEDWVNLSLKRLITDAVNNGYKKVAFINGEQSADRYDLSKQVTSIGWKTYDEKAGAVSSAKVVTIDMGGEWVVRDGNNDLLAEGFTSKESASQYAADYAGATVRAEGGNYLYLTLDKDGTVKDVPDGSISSKEQFIGKGLDEIIGKGLAEKIVSEQGGSLSGEGLKIGGEGMKKFYDQIVPATANKLLKKLGGGKLEPMQIGDNQQLGFTITPEMVELVKKQGLPMFAAGGAVTMAKGGKVAKGMSGISAAREAMKAQRREERVQKNLEAYMGSAEKPQTYYHATQAPKDFRKFDLEKRPTPKSAAAVFLTPSTDWANEFDMADLKTLESATSAAPRIMPMITRAKNTFDYDDPGHVTQVMNQVELPPGIDRQHVADEIAGGNWNFIEDRNIQKAIKDLGFDSFNIKEKGVKNLGVFNPADVKALFNRGSYDPTTEDISKAAGGPVLKGIAKARAEAKMSTGGKAVKGADSALSGIAAARAAQKAQRANKLEEALEAKQPPMTTPQGTGLPLMPRDQGMYIPGVKQEDLPRMPKVDKARAAGKRPEYTERMEDLLQSRAAKKKVDTLIEKGDALGMREWYGIEPLRQVAMDIGMSPEKFNEFIAQMASASQRNPVDQQNRMGSYLWHLSQTGGLPSNAFLYTNKMRRGKQGLPEGSPIELPSGYGSLAQGDIFNRGLQIARGDIEGALPPDKKLGTFYRNYLGNLRPVTVDVNAVRGPIIERGDPRWLASKLVEKDEEGNVTGTYFPRKDVQSGLMSIKQAKERPGFWEAAPSGSEYAGFEDLWQSAAKRFGIQPAEAQALGWYGSADVTALKTKPELYIDNLERMIRRTAEQTGKNPRQVMEDMLRGTEYLRKKGGLVRS